MHQLPVKLRDNVRLLGDLLGQILTSHEGEELYNSVEKIRSISKALAKSRDADYTQLIDELAGLDDDQILPLARAFNQFLNLANIADQQHYSSAGEQGEDSLKLLVEELAETNNERSVVDAIEDMQINLVLTAHPTEVSRRTLIHKYNTLIKTLDHRNRGDLLEYQKDKLEGRLYRIIEEIWKTDEIRIHRPTAVDEARWGFTVIEDSLWQAVPDMVRHLDRVCRTKFGSGLGLRAQPFTFCSWMGGDRDGNPNVTHKVTREVLLLGRQKAAHLYARDIDALSADLSMHNCSDELREHLDNPESRVPYREFLRALKKKLLHTRDWATAAMEGNIVSDAEGVIKNRDEILEPLLLCHRSLNETGCAHIANGPLVEVIRRVVAFGINLSPIDVRQDADRHVFGP